MKYVSIEHFDHLIISPSASHFCLVSVLIRTLAGCATIPLPVASNVLFDKKVPWCSKQRFLPAVSVLLRTLWGASCLAKLDSLENN